VNEAINQPFFLVKPFFVIDTGKTFKFLLLQIQPMFVFSFHNQFYPHYSKVMEDIYFSNS